MIDSDSAHHGFHFLIDSSSIYHVFYYLFINVSITVDDISYFLSNGVDNIFLKTKIKAFEKAGVKLAKFPTDIADLVEKHI